MAKYLDQEGLKYLWGKITDADNANQTKTDEALALKGGYIEYANDGFIKLWASEADSKTEGKNPLSKFDASAFIADGMLDDVTIIASSEDTPINYEGTEYTDGTKFIKFSWNAENADGTQKVDYLKIDEIGKVYTGSSSINIDENNQLSVSNVSSAKVTTEEITVEGGPLADILKSAGINKIDSNMDMYTLLLKLACKEMWPESTSFTAGKATVSIKAPSFTLSNSGTTVEVGTKCALSEITLPEAAIPGSTTPKVTGFTNGYSSADNNTKEFSSTEALASIKDGYPQLLEGNYKLAIDYTGFNSEADISNAAEDADYSKIEYGGNDGLIATLGTNTVKASVTGPKAYVEFESIPEYYACSNLNNTHNETGVFHKSTAQENLNYTSGASSNSKSLSVTGKYKYFAGYTTITDVTTMDSDSVRALTGISNPDQEFLPLNSGESLTLIGGATKTEDGKSVVFAIPTTYTLSVQEGMTGSEMIGAGFKEAQVSVKTGELTTTYNVYMYPITSPTGSINIKNVIISK